jgi:hypothetical protein
VSNGYCLQGGLPARWTIVPYDEVDFHTFENISTGVQILWERVNKRFQVVNIAQPHLRFVLASRPRNIAIDNEAHAGYCFAIQRRLEA